MVMLMAPGHLFLTSNIGMIAMLLSKSFLVQKRSQKRFGWTTFHSLDEGVNIYNKLMDVIGEQDKGCLPLINRCLRIYLDKLTKDMDLWDDLYSLSFDKWKADELKMERKNPWGKKTMN